MKLPINEIVSDERCQTRAATDESVVEEYRTAYVAGASMPPIEVFRVGGVAVIVDGTHRYLAASLAAVRWLEVVEVGSGSWDEAQWYALAANKAHGLRRSNADKRRTVEVALRNPIAQEQSSRVVAEQCGVDHKTLEKIRRELQAAGEVAPRKTRTDSLGRQQPAAKSLEKPGDVGKVATPDPEPGAGTPHDDSTPSVLPAYADDYAQQADAILALRRVVVTALGRHGEATHQTMHRVRDALTDAARILGHATPVVCPQCQGPGCRRCGERGWIEAGQRTQSEAAE